MNIKRKTATLLAAIALMGIFMTGCTDKENDEEQRRAAEERARYSRESMDPNRTPPSRHPDGTLG